MTPRNDTKKGVFGHQNAIKNNCRKDLHGVDEQTEESDVVKGKKHAEAANAHRPWWSSSARQ